MNLLNTKVDASGNDLCKLRYLFSGRKIKKLISLIQPDVINVHYASSYGAVMALSGVSGYFLSVWGSDIYDFPRKSFLHKILLKYSLKKATALFSTSAAMAKEAQKYTKKSFEITPFGVDLDIFTPCKRTRKAGDNRFIVGTVKGLSDTYGIRNILEAVAIVNHHFKVPIELRIAGKGPQEKEYRKIAKNLCIEDLVKWLGFISQEEAATEWANMDIAVIPSIKESFGVSALEAQACGTPVIISDVQGLIEATAPGKSSIVVSKNNSNSIADAIIKLYEEQELRVQFGKYGREYVMNNYEINQCFERIEDSFERNFAR